MLHHEDLLYKLRFILFGVLVFAGLLLLSIIVIGVGGNGAQALNNNDSTGVFSESESPNAVLGGMSNAAYGFNQTMTRVSRSLNAELRSMATTTAQFSSATARGAQDGLLFGAHTAAKSVRLVGNATNSSFAFVGHTIGSGFAFAGNTIGHSASFLTRTTSDSFAIMVHTPGKVAGIVSPTQAVGNIIRPEDHTTIPIIDPRSPALLAARKAMAATPATASNPSSNAKPQWPIHGVITTLFGTPHAPFQPIHTGMDISDGRAPGTTPIKPFKPGKVVQVIHSGIGLGNHVVVDHGSGVTSVYAHLNSISVREGQKVGGKTVLGFEGSTGASTGSHLHFEIRVHGQAADPLKFISGRP